MGKKIYQVIIICFWVLGVLGAGYGILRIIEANKCKNWTRVKGRIMDSYVAEITDLPNNKTTETSLPDIKYEYSFKGVTYFSQNIGYYGKETLGLSDSFYAGTEDEVNAFIDKYPINGMVDVYVNPETPAQSVLDTGLKLPVFMPFLFGILLIFAGFHIYLFGNLYIPNSQKTGKLI